MPLEHGPFPLDFAAVFNTQPAKTIAPLWYTPPFSVPSDKQLIVVLHIHGTTLANPAVEVQEDDEWIDTTLAGVTPSRTGYAIGFVAREDQKVLGWHGELSGVSQMRFRVCSETRPSATVKFTTFTYPCYGTEARTETRILDNWIETGLGRLS